MCVLIGGSQTLCSRNPLTLLKLIEDFKEFLFRWVIPTNIYHILN